MGQKSRSKKHRSKQQHQKNNQQRVVTDTMPASLMGDATPVVQARPVLSKALAMDIQTEYIRSDIVRILLLLVVMAVVIAIFFVLGEKTDYLQTAGKELSRFFRLQ